LRVGPAPPAALAALLVGWAARLYRLGEQSFWYDEGTSATVAPRDVATILQNAAADIHPPLYYLLLHVWIGPAGTTEWAIRLPSVGFGLLTVALVYRLGRDLLGPLGGLSGALLTALAPLPVWYSQEARMYALATAAARRSCSGAPWSARPAGASGPATARRPRPRSTATTSRPRCRSRTPSPSRR
jgi:uncharacterized membrane protein